MSFFDPYGFEIMHEEDNALFEAETLVWVKQKLRDKKQSPQMQILYRQLMTDCVHASVEGKKNLEYWRHRNFTWLRKQAELEKRKEEASENE